MYQQKIMVTGGYTLKSGHLMWTILQKGLKYVYQREIKKKTWPSYIFEGNALQLNLLHHY